MRRRRRRLRARACIATFHCDLQLLPALPGRRRVAATIALVYAICVCSRLCQFFQAARVVIGTCFRVCNRSISRSIANRIASIVAYFRAQNPHFFAPRTRKMATNHSIRVNSGYLGSNRGIIKVAKKQSGASNLAHVLDCANRDRLHHLRLAVSKIEGEILAAHNRKFRMRLFGIKKFQRGFEKSGRQFFAAFRCADTFSGRSCFYEGRLGYASGLNFVVLIGESNCRLWPLKPAAVFSVNIVLLVLNILSVSSYNLEKLYSIVTCVLFLIAAALLVWMLVVHVLHTGENWRMIAAVVLVCVQFVLFLYDVSLSQEIDCTPLTHSFFFQVRILQGEVSN